MLSGIKTAVVGTAPALSGQHGPGARRRPPPDIRRRTQYNHDD
ncbi:hypothetical protein XCR_0020 [Xanthomonas campestris pv. raphani 756C]|nr:hypothetical protein XCR_0020 [Xanthomonas campestris pv. raphani 756C]